MLLHTLRTQLDIFHKVIPLLSDSFTIHALDYPGHGYSDIPRTDYTPQFFANSVEGFLEDRMITDAKVAGVSIGASIAMMLASGKNPNVSRVVAINPYDYRGGGVGRGNLVAKAVFTACKIPVVGSITMLLNNRLVERKVLEGGVFDATSMAVEFSDEVFAVGTRRGYARGFLNLVKHANRWSDIKEGYPNIEAPTLLVYGDHDWANESERATTARLLSPAQMETVENGGHFPVIDQPEKVADLIKSF